MKTYRFNKKNNKTNALIAILGIISGYLIFYGIENGLISSYFAAFVISTFSFIITIKKVKKSKMEFYEIIISEDNLVANYFKTTKKQFTSKIQEITLESNDDGLKIFNNKGLLAGFAFKSKLEIKSEWDELLLELKSNKN
ncbi:MAG: hypothetical protein AB7S69_04490 [Salinivirgaceae bacterium]